MNENYITNNLHQRRTISSQNTNKERSLKWYDRFYLLSVFKGLLYSFKQMFQPKFTRQYPEEKWIPSPVFRGRPVLVQENNKERCVACGLCALSCPPLAINMQASEDPDDPKERYPSVFEINMLRCIYCGYCEEVCPEEAIVMSNEYDIVYENREDAVYGKDKLLIPKEKLEPRLKWLRKYKNKQLGKSFAYQPHNNIHSVRDRNQTWNTNLSIVDIAKHKS